MARTLAFEYKRGEIIQTSPKNIIFDEENNGRAFLYKPEDLEDLLTDLREGRPINQPILCKAITTESGQGLSLVAGQRRLLAGLEYLKENPDYLIKVLIVVPKTETEELELNVVENAGRKNLSIIDQGHIALRLREEPTKEGGRTLEQIAKLLRVSQPQVSQAIKLVEGLPERVQRAVHQGSVTVSDALDVLKVSDPDKRASLIEEFFAAKSSGTPVRNETTNSISPFESAPFQEEKPRTVRQAVREAGAKVTMKMSEFRKYLQVAIDEEGPGSNKGEVTLKKKLLEFLDGKITDPRTMDKHFDAICKMRG
jgi:ParB/RepB/Spo0J family partition protein